MTLVGQTLADRYDLLDELGAGAFGTVYRAYDRELDEMVALKVIHTALAGEPAMLERFRHEVKLARRVTHTNIARTFELASSRGIVFCTMELIDGESLRARLTRQTQLPIAEAIAIARALCDGLHAAHTVGVVHRDLKPDNVLIASDGRVVLADFGVAAAAASAGGEIAGTPAYMPPEQARGEPASPASDIYALGVILREMVGGLDGIPVEVARVIERAIAPERTARIASASELGRELDECAQARGTQISPGPASGARQIATVVVLAPRADGDGARLHLADGVHSELLRRLMRLPRVRVLPRVVADVPDATVVEQRVGEQLAVTIRSRDGATTTLTLPLAIDAVTIAADAAAAAIARVIDAPAADAGAREASELVLRARLLARRAFRFLPEALELTERASQLAPGDPVVVASHALVCTNLTVISGDAGSERLGRTNALVEHALEIAPDIAESHVAAAQLLINTGDPVRAARHFRTAIACSPHFAEAHEGLGRMLLEAGFTDRALARIEDALAIAPHLSTVRWELARDLALAGRWAEHDRLIQELSRDGARPIVELRHASWRRDAAAIAELRTMLPTTRGIDPAFLGRIADVYTDGAWHEARAELIAATNVAELLQRRRAFVAQLVAEAAGYAGDAETSLAMIELAVRLGLYDLAWLDCCPLLAPARAHVGYGELRDRVARRAEAILDALYGDHDPAALGDTVVL